MSTSSSTTPRSHRSSIEALEARIAPAVIFALDGADKLISFDSATPGTVLSSVPITGLGAGETLLGFDFRPATGVLTGLTIGAGGVGKLYTFNASGAATAGATLVADIADGTNPYAGLTGTSFGLDFNPTVDRLRVVSDTEQNLRINVLTGAVTTDGAINPGDPALVGSAYTNSFAGTATTSLFGIDAAADTLVIQNPPNNGTLVTVGPLGVNIDSVLSFDILTTGTTNIGYAAFKVAGGDSGFYTINLTTGAATLVGDIGGAGVSEIRGLSAVPNQALTFATNGKKATFTDVDGDAVTVSVSAGALSIPNFQLGGLDFQLVASGLGYQLQTVNFSDDLGEFADVSLSITAKRLEGGSGDGYVNVGTINATGSDLTNVTVDGDLGQIDAGDATATTAAIDKLTVQSIGLFGTSTQNAGSTNSTSALVGAVGKISVKSGVANSSITLSGGADGDLGQLNVRGSFENSNITVSGSVGAILPLNKTSGGLLLKGNVTTAVITVGDSVSNVKITGNLDNSSLLIGGNTSPQTDEDVIALATLSVGGRVSGSLINVGGPENNGDVEVGKVIVGTDWIASNLAVGIGAGVDTFFGTDDDVVLDLVADDVTASIAKIQIKGIALGTVGSTTDRFGFVSEDIFSFRVGSTTFPLTPDSDNFAVGATSDLRVREYGVVLV